MVHVTVAAAIDRVRRASLADHLRVGARGLAVVAIAGLTLFHAVLLWHRIVDLTLLEPGVWLRWAGALAVLAGWCRLRRTGLPLLRGRRALALCLLAALLHAPFAPPAPALEVPPPSSLLLILPATLTLSTAVAVAAGLALLIAMALASVPSVASGRIDSRPIVAARAAVIPALACRPPPA